MQMALHVMTKQPFIFKIRNANIIMPITPKRFFNGKYRKGKSFRERVCIFNF